MTENPILQHQKLTILQQIDELKNWHKQQQSKLNYQSSSHEKQDLTEEGNNKQKHGYNRVKYTSNCKVNKNSHQSTAPIPNFDDTPVKGVQPNLDEIIVNGNPRQDSRQLHSIDNVEKPKFRFLKKGEGIARFRMGPVKVAKTKNSKNINLQQSSNAQRSNQNNCAQPLKPEPNVEIEQMPVLQPPDLKLDFKNWKSIFNEGNAIQIIEHAIDNNQLDIFQPNSSIDSSTASIMEKLLTIGRKHLKEKEEMRVFETIEQHILDSSFCSTSSYVTRLMENAVVSTPEKIIPSYDCEKSNHVEEKQMLPIVLKGGQLGERAKLDQKILEEQNQIVKIPVWTNAPDNENERNKFSIDSGDLNLEQSLHVRFNEEVDYKSFVECSQYSSNSKENNISKTFEDSEEWKEDSSDDSICCSQCGSENRSLDEDVTLVNTHVKTPNLVNNEQINEKKLIDTQKYEEGLVEKLNIKDLSTANPPSVESKALSKDIDTFSPILNTKLKELENEIEAFRTENNKVKLIREKLEKEHKQFQLEKKQFLKEIEEERKRNTNQLEEEKQKLSKEKFIFEKYSKSLTKKPSKEERKEMQALREQLIEMKEDFNKKESRWGAAQARVRNQIKLLEEDNKKLREEVEVLRKQAKNLQILTQQKNKRTVNNTKLIHAINDHITTIGPVSDDDAFIDVGYFKPSNNNVKTVIIEDVDPKTVKNVKVVRENVEKIISTVSNKGQNRLAQLNKDDINGDKTTPNNDNMSYELISSDKLAHQVNSKLNEEIQRRSKSPLIENVLPNTIKETINEDGSVEKTYPDGKKEIRLKNGNVKKIDTINGYEKTIYFNGDVKELSSNGTVKYYFSESRIWHTTLPDGLEVLDFPDGQVEKRHKNGTVEIIYPNDCKKVSYPDGVEEIFYADGTSIKIEGDRRKVLSLPNGQKEIHTDESIRREYPDGTVKIVYPDGTTETVYSNGRVRLKDKHGNLVMDSGAAAPVKL